MRRPRVIPRVVVAFALLLLPQALAQSRPLLEQKSSDVYVPPIATDLHGGLSHNTGNGFGPSPAGGPCERAYQRALRLSHPSWWDRYEACARQEQSR